MAKENYAALAATSARENARMPQPGAREKPTQEYARFFEKAGEGQSEVLQENVQGKFTLASLPWFEGREEDPLYEAKVWFALTIGRGALRNLDLLDENKATKALGFKGDLPPGFYLLGPDGKLACAYALDIAEKGKGRHGSKDAMEQALKALEKAGLADEETHLSHVLIDPVQLASGENKLGDALNGGFSEDSLKVHGILCGDKALAEKGYSGGFASAWSMPSAQLHGGKDQDAMTLDWLDMAGAPLINHNGASFVKNIRNLCHVNNKDLSFGANQIEERREMVQTLINNWLGAKMSLTGVWDQEQNGIDEKILGSERAQKEREKAAASYQIPIGNAKALGVRTIGTFVRFGKNGAKGAMVISRDMALHDGQHSSRNYGLIAKALNDKAGSAPSWEESTIDGARVWVTVDMCSLDEFRKEFETLTGIKEGKIPEDCAKMLHLAGLSPKTAFGNFVEFAKAVRTEVKKVPSPNASAAAAQARIANKSHGVALADKAEHEYGALFAEIASGFNKIAQKRGEPERLAVTKDARNDPAWATNTSCVVTVQSIFGPLLAVASEERSSYSMEGLKSDNLAEQAKSLIQSLFGLTDEEELALVSGKLKAVALATAKAKARDYALTSKRGEKLKKVWPKLMDYKQEEATAGGKGFGWDAFKLGMARWLGIDVKNSSKRPNQAEMAYATVKSAIELSKAIDEAWRAVSKATSPTKGFFDSKATFENWMLLGLIMSDQNLSDPKSWEAVKEVPGRIAEGMKEGLIPKKLVHNKAREGFIQTKDALVDGIKKGDFELEEVNLFEKMDPWHMVALYEAFPFSEVSMALPKKPGRPKEGSLKAFAAYAISKIPTMVDMERNKDQRNKGLLGRERDSVPKKKSRRGKPN